MINEQDQAIGSRIKLIRTSLGLSMEEFGKMLRPVATKGTVSKWENGKYIPNGERLKNIAALGNTTVAYLLRPANGEVTIETAVDVAKDIFYKKLSNKDNLRDETLSALEYFNNDSLDLVLEQEVSRYLSNPDVGKSEKLRNLNDKSDFETYLIHYLEIRYKKEVPTNQHLIELICKYIPKNPDDYEDFFSPLIETLPLRKVLNDSPQLIPDDERLQLEELANRNATLFFSQFESAVDPKLKAEIEAILNETRQKVRALKEKYPDKPSKIEQDTKVFGGKQAMWWQRGQKEKNTSLNIPESTKQEIIALGSTLLEQKEVSDTPHLSKFAEDEDIFLGGASRLYPRESKY